MTINPIRRSVGSRPATSAARGRREERRSPAATHDRPDGSGSRFDAGTFNGTVIYVHGIANKPIASVLKCQWDHALFDAGMGQRTRMVYWVNRDRYPDPDNATCEQGDFSEGFDLDHSDDSLRDGNHALRMEMARSQIDRLMQPHESATNQSRREQIADRMISLADRIDTRAETQPVATSAEVLPLPRWARNRITRLFTRYLLNDVYDYFYDPFQQQRIDSVFRARIFGGGPFVVIGHSLGSVIAFKNLCEMSESGDLDPNSVRLFLTLGSPLGLQEVQDGLKESLDVERLVKPECIQRWANLADRLDYVAADARLANDIDDSIIDHGVRNLDRPRHPHSATGYLGLPLCQESVRRVVGAAFTQPISSFSIARDLTDRIENAFTQSDGPADWDGGSKHHVLIELNERDGVGLVEARKRLYEEISETLGAETVSQIRFIELRRYLAADLTSSQIERLGPVLRRRSVGRVWGDSQKQCLASAVAREDPVQSAAAARVYGADGSGIEWAVLDTGVEPDHPHFQTHRNIRAMWDCTGRGPTIDDDHRHAVDRHGHGTHVAAIIAGAVQQRGDRRGARDGVAPKTGLHSYRVLDARGRGRDSYIIRALDHIASINESSSKIVIHGVNLSLGGPFDPETYGCGHSPICRELRRLWRQGVLVVVAAGNAGFAELQSSRGTLRTNLDLSIGDPANLEQAIAVGSVHLSNPLTYGTSFFSSRGPTADGRQKPDLVAPGERVPSANYAYQTSEDYIELSGTSMAAPHVSGLLSAFLSQRRELIGEPDRVKSILLENCTSLHRDPYVQGAGLPNLVRMLLST